MKDSAKHLLIWLNMAMRLYSGRLSEVVSMQDGAQNLDTPLADVG